jgi:hypothetical protein
MDGLRAVRRQRVDGIAQLAGEVVGALAEVADAESVIAGIERDFVGVLADGIYVGESPLKPHGRGGQHGEIAFV